MSAAGSPWRASTRLLRAAFALAILVAVLRRPDFVLLPQLWAEDGPVWFQQAYALGPLTALPLPYAGYYHLVPRLIGSVGALAGVANAPRVIDALSIVVYAAPVPIALALARTRREAGFLGLCAALYLLLPYSRETHFSATTANWPLALCLFLAAVRLTDPARDRRRDGPWLALAAICGLSGPFALFLLPAVPLLVGRVAGWRWPWRGPRGNAPGASTDATPDVSPGASWQSAWRVLAVLAACSAVQLTHVFAGSRAEASLEAVPLAVAARIAGGQIVAGGLLGEGAVRALYAAEATAAYALLAGLYVVVIVRGAVLGDRRLRAYLLYAHLVLAAALLYAPASPGADILAELQAPGNGQRYWLLSTLGFLACAAWIALAGRHRLERALSAALLPAFLVGAALDFRLAPLPDLGWADEAARYCALAEGEAAAIPINPPGWQVELVRRGDGTCP